LASGWLSRNRTKLVLALRMTASALATFAVAEALGLSQGFWAVITALIVTQSNVGGSLKAALDRFVGSLLGAVYGSAVAFAIPHADDLTRALALVVAVAPLSFMAAYSASFRVAPITAIIVLLSASGATLGPLGFATDRVLEVGLGCAIGLLISVLVVPARASRSVVETAAETTRLLAEQMEALAVQDDQAQVNLSALAVRTRKSLNRLETLVGEATRERRSRLTDMPDPEPLLRTLMRLRHDVVMVRRAVGEPGLEVSSEHPAQTWASAARAGAATLGKLADALSAGQSPAPSDAMADAIGAYRASIDELRRSKRTRILPTDTLWRMFGAGFALEQFRRDLDDLVERVEDFAAHL
jgi:uncharacterized membrane protein YccC